MSGAAVLCSRQIVELSHRVESLQAAQPFAVCGNRQWRWQPVGATGASGRKGYILTECARRDDGHRGDGSRGAGDQLANRAFPQVAVISRCAGGEPSSPNAQCPDLLRA